MTITIDERSREQIAFVRDRLGEEHDRALAAMSTNHDETPRDPDKDGGVWKVSDDPYDGGCRIEGDHMVIYNEGGHTPAQARHIASQDPAAILRDVEAKRYLLHRITKCVIEFESIPVDQDDSELAMWTTVLEELAWKWADHPDFLGDTEPVRFEDVPDDPIAGVEADNARLAEKMKTIREFETRPLTQEATDFVVNEAARGHVFEVPLGTVRELRPERPVNPTSLGPFPYKFDK